MHSFNAHQSSHTLCIYIVWTQTFEFECFTKPCIYLHIWSCTNVLTLRDLFISKCCILKSASDIKHALYKQSETWKLTILVFKPTFFVFNLYAVPFLINAWAKCLKKSVILLECRTWTATSNAQEGPESCQYGSTSDRLAEAGFFLHFHPVFAGRVILAGGGTFCWSSLSKGHRCCSLVYQITLWLL